MWYCEPGTPIQNEREKYQIDGDGFVWTHKTMDSLEALDQIDRMFLTIDESLWLPQWSFDFWTIPYLIGKGMSLDRFREMIALAHKMLALEIATVPTNDKKSLQEEYLESMIAAIGDWDLKDSVAFPSQGTSRPPLAANAV
jgi:p-methyltransferase